MAASSINSRSVPRCRYVKINGCYICVSYHAIEKTAQFCCSALLLPDVTFVPPAEGGSLHSP